MKLRNLPDTNHSLYDSRDFIVSSALAKKAFLADWKGISLGIPALIDAIDRLMQSCHLAEFTDHGLSHLCSLVNRISHWTLNDSTPLVETINPNEAAILLVATLIHDMGMLSQKAEDLPIDANALYQKAAWGDLAAWVRKTHVIRLEGLVRRLLKEMQLEGVPIKEFEDAILSGSNNTFIEQAIIVASAHEKWPWTWDKYFENFTVDEKLRLRGLAAVVAVSDLLDEDAARCDTQTLLLHRHGTPLNIAHWLRHQLTEGRIMIERGGIEVRMKQFRNINERLKPVYGALRNHFRLVLAYEAELNALGLNAGVRIRELSPATGVPDEWVAAIDLDWRKLHGFSTESALCYQLLKTFMNEAVKKTPNHDSSSLSPLIRLGLEDVDLSSYGQIEGDHEILTHHEKTFRAITDEESPSSLKEGFKFLWSEANNAHIAGDGILVLHILEIASTKLSSWAKQENSNITSLDVEWFFAMKLFWGMGIVDIGHELHEFDGIQENTFKLLDPVSKLLIELIFAHFKTYLGNVDISQVKEKITLEWIVPDTESDFQTRAHTILLSLLIEHSWLRSRENSDWSELLDHSLTILESDFPLIHQQFVSVKERLLRQKDLIELKTAVNPGPLSSEEVRRAEEAYRFYLNAQWDKLEQSLQTAQSQVDFQSPYYSAWHSLNRSSTFSSIEPDSYATQISRWFVYRSSSPLERYVSLLDERLSEKKEEEIDYKYSNQSPTIPSVAKQIITLQQIEIHTLRTWNLIRYRFVLEDRAKCLMSIAHSESSSGKKAEFAFHAICTFALAMNIPEKDSRFRRLFNFLAFGNPDNYEAIIEIVLQSPKREWTRLSKILELLNDAIPESLVERIVQWYMQLENVPLKERMGQATYLNEMVSVVRCSHDTEQWIDRLFDLYNESSITFADKFIEHVIKKGTKEQVKRLWNIQIDPEKVNWVFPERLWEFGFDIIRQRADLCDDLRDWLEKNCPDDPNSKHNLSQVLGNDSVEETNTTSDRILTIIEKSFDNLDSNNPITFQFYGKLPWSKERVLPLLDRIELNILEGKCNSNHIGALLSIMALFSENADGELLAKLSGVCSKLLSVDNLPIKNVKIRDQFVSTLMFGHDPEGDVVRRLLFFAEDLFDDGGQVEMALFRYLRKNHVSLINSSNAFLWARCILKLSINPHFDEKEFPIRIALLEIGIQSLFAEPNDHTETDMANVVRVMGAVLFDTGETNQYAVRHMTDGWRRSQILTIFEEMLQIAAQGFYPSVRAAACEMILKWKMQESSSNNLRLPDSLCALSEKLKNDPHARVRFAYEKMVKHGEELQ